MKTFTPQDYAKYTDTALKLESSLYVQQEMIQQLDRRYASQEPRLRLEEEPKQPALKTVGSNVGWIALLIIGLICFLLLFYIDSESEILAALLLLPLGGFGAVLVLGGCAGWLSDSQKAQSNNQLMSEYNAKLQAVRERNKSASAAYKERHAEWESAGAKYRESREFMLTQLKQTAAVRNVLYSMNIIYPKYRTIPALAAICEYFTTGRCAGLTGPNGAYNLYEDELRKNTMISQLNTIIANLEQIRSTQYMLYQQVSQIQQTTQRMARSLQRVEGCMYDIRANTEITAYYTGVTAANLNYMRIVHDLG